MNSPGGLPLKFHFQMAPHIMQYTSNHIALIHTHLSEHLCFSAICPRMLFHCLLVWVAGPWFVPSSSSLGSSLCNAMGFVALRGPEAWKVLLMSVLNCLCSVLCAFLLCSVLCIRQKAITLSETYREPKLHVNYRVR